MYNVTKTLCTDSITAFKGTEFEDSGKIFKRKSPAIPSMHAATGLFKRSIETLEIFILFYLADSDSPQLDKILNHAFYLMRSSINTSGKLTRLKSNTAKKRARSFRWHCS